jgi:hypothetical protein
MQVNQCKIMDYHANMNKAINEIEDDLLTMDDLRNKINQNKVRSPI